MQWQVEAVQYGRKTGWLLIEQSAGTVEAGESDFLRVLVDSSGLSAGLYWAVIPVTSTGDDTTIAVILWVPLFN